MAWKPDPEDPAADAPLLITSDGARKGTEITDGQIDLPIADRVVCAVAVSRFTPYLRLHLWGANVPDSASGPDFTLQIEGPLRIVTKEREWTIDPESGPDPAYLRLVTKTISRATAWADGSLEVGFTDGDRLLVPPFEYEPWQLNGDDGSLVVSAAGGGLAVWSAATGKTD